MSVKLRLKRFGRRHLPFYRLNAIDSRSPRDGKTIEELGHFDPVEKDQAKQLVINADRVKYWLSVGAVPSPTVVNLLRKSGIEVKVKRKSLKTTMAAPKVKGAAKAAEAAAPAA